MASDRAYEPGPVDIRYAPDWLERRVGKTDTIKLHTHMIHISHSLGGMVVGLQPVADRLDVWFDYLRLGHIDLHHFKFFSGRDGSEAASPLLRPPSHSHYGLPGSLGMPRRKPCGGG